jgi:hypothetical protein
MHNRLFEAADNYISSQFDVIELLKKIQEIEKLKIILFDES